MNGEKLVFFRRRCDLEARDILIDLASQCAEDPDESGFWTLLNASIYLVSRISYQVDREHALQNYMRSFCMSPSLEALNDGRHPGEMY